MHRMRVISLLIVTIGFVALAVFLVVLLDQISPAAPNGGTATPTATTSASRPGAALKP